MELLQLKQLGCWDKDAAGLSLAPPSSMELMHHASCSSTIPFNSDYNVFAKDNMTNPIASPSLSAVHVASKRKRERYQSPMLNSTERNREEKSTDHTTMTDQSSSMLTVASKHDIELNQYNRPLPLGWEQCLDIKTGEMYYVNSSTRAKTREDPRKHCEDLMPLHWPYNLQIWAINDKAPAAPSSGLENSQLDLSLNLSSKRIDRANYNNKRAADLARNPGINQIQSVDIIGVKEESQEDRNDNEMVAVPCRNCLMFVMLPKASPQCPKCGKKLYLPD